MGASNGINLARVLALAPGFHALALAPREPAADLVTLAEHKNASAQTASDKNPARPAKRIRLGQAINKSARCATMRVAIWGGKPMKRLYWTLPIALVGLVFPALAQSIDPKLMQGIQKLDADFTESFNKQDAAGVAREFTRNGILLSQTPQGAVHSGTQAIIQRYDGLFKLGANHLDVTRSQLTPLDNDVAIALGEYHVTGQAQNGPIKVDGDWSATYVRDAGTWKIRLLSIVPKPPPR